MLRPLRRLASAHFRGKAKPVQFSKFTQEAWKSALFGMSESHDRKVYVGSVKALPANAPTIRDEAAREYEYLHRTLESLDNKAGIALGGSLALVTIAAASDGRADFRWLVGVLAFLAGMLSGSTFAPSAVRGMGTHVMATKYGDRPAAEFHLRVAAQYIDAIAAMQLPAKVKVIRLRTALVLLFLSAVCLAVR